MDRRALPVVLAVGLVLVLPALAGCIGGGDGTDGGPAAGNDTDRDDDPVIPPGDDRDDDEDPVEPPPEPEPPTNGTPSFVWLNATDSKERTFGDRNMSLPDPTRHPPLSDGCGQRTDLQQEALATVREESFLLPAPINATLLNESLEVVTFEMTLTANVTWDVAAFDADLCLLGPGGGVLAQDSFGATTDGVTGTRASVTVDTADPALWQEEFTARVFTTVGAPVVGTFDLAFLAAWDIALKMPAPADAGGSTGDVHTVLIGNEVQGPTANYDPDPVRVQVGDSVKWRNVDGTQPHTATRNEGDGQFDTGNLDEGDESARISFTEPGTYSYFCEVHGEDNMSATVIVEE